MMQRSISLVLLTGCLALASCAGRPRATTQATVAPPTTVSDVDGKPVSVLEGLEDHRATVLLFITIDCPISNSYAPEIHRLCDAYAKQGVAFYVVYADPYLPRADVAKHHREYGYRCAGLVDVTHELVDHTGVTMTPEAAVILPTGELVYRGRINDLYIDFGKARYAPTTHDLKDVLEAIVQGRAVSARFTDAIGCHIPEK